MVAGLCDQHRLLLATTARIARALDLEAHGFVFEARMAGMAVAGRGREPFLGLESPRTTECWQDSVQCRLAAVGVAGRRRQEEEVAEGMQQ